MRTHYIVLATTICNVYGSVSQCCKDHCGYWNCQRIRAKNSSDVQSETQDVIDHQSIVPGWLLSDYFFVQSCTMSQWYESMICLLISIAVLCHTMTVMRAGSRSIRDGSTSLVVRG